MIGWDLPCHPNVIFRQKFLSRTLKLIIGWDLLTHFEFAQIHLLKTPALMIEWVFQSKIKIHGGVKHTVLLQSFLLITFMSPHFAFPAEILAALDFFCLLRVDLFIPFLPFVRQPSLNWTLLCKFFWPNSQNATHRVPTVMSLPASVLALQWPSFHTCSFELDDSIET